jgi:hypothetical protein
MLNLLVQLLSFEGLNDENHNEYNIEMNLTEVAQDKIYGRRVLTTYLANPQLISRAYLC